MPDQPPLKSEPNRDIEENDNSEDQSGLYSDDSAF